MLEHVKSPVMQFLNGLAWLHLLLALFSMGLIQHICIYPESFNGTNVNSSTQCTTSDRDSLLPDMCIVSCAWASKHHVPTGTVVFAFPTPTINISGNHKLLYFIN